MPLVATEHAPESRRRVVQAFLAQGVVGATMMVWLTWLHSEETVEIWEALGPSAPLLVAIYAGFALGLARLKFGLTDKVFVSLVITAYISMFSILGLVISSWVAVSATAVNRLLDMAQIGSNPTDMSDPTVEWIKTFGLFGTYGIPVIAATSLYVWLGGQIPLRTPSIAAAAQIALCAIVLIATNNLIIARVERAYGYSPGTSLKLAAIDGSIYLATLPYAIMTAFAWGTVGWGGVAASAFTGILVSWVGKSFALTRSANERQIKQLASLANIGKAISLRSTIEELLRTIYDECRKVMDLSMFTIALVDESHGELSFELDVRNGEFYPRFRIPIGEGLNSWVVEHQQPLVLSSNREEHLMGLRSVDDGMPTESWLGVPMISRDHLIGVLSVQSYRKNAYREDDVILLTAVANQAAVAIRNSHLYQDLEGLNLALEQRVAERTNELRETNLRLVAADRSKNQFLANMSHELRTPLNSIIGFSTILLDTTRATLQPRLYKFIENIRDSGSHLLVLINDILDLSKIEAGRLQLQPCRFDLRETFATVERVIRGIAAESSVAVTTRVDSDVPQVVLDENRIKQVMLNLLSNAVKFSRRGGSVSMIASFVQLDESPLGCDSVRIEVRDTGIGIPTDEHRRIFDEFYQVDEARRTRKGGTGLGLSLARSFVELHHGTIDVDSELGSGATFTIHLPVRHDLDDATRARSIAAK